MESISLRLESCSAAPLYRQLYDFFVREIRTGSLQAGEKVPSKRRLAADLQVSVNTVDTAYQMLAAEGYLTGRPRSGFTVCRLEHLPPTAAPVQPAPAAQASPAARAWLYDFETATVDTSLFPFKVWRRTQRDLLAGNPQFLNHGHRQGDENLRAAIAKHLHEYRGAQCTAQQIVVGAGMEYLLGLLARLFAGATFAVENPGYARTARILQNNGATVAFAPVDAQGLSAQALARSGAQLAYVTPSHQFPTGVTMPVGRRTELLHWANAGPGRYLIEDDYDSEFRFDGRPLPSLQGLDDAGRVIYIGTFSKSIAPAIRIAYMVLPPALLPAYEAAFGFYSCTVSRFEQQTLCRFMEDGHFARHLARLRNAYRLRRDALVAALYDALGPRRIAIAGSHTGLHLLVEVKGALSGPQLVERAAAQGVRLNGLFAYDHLPSAAPAAPVVVLGYAGLALEDIPPAAQALARAWTM